jgi:hypothetical protein
MQHRRGGVSQLYRHQRHGQPASRIDGGQQAVSHTNLVCSRTAEAIRRNFALREIDTVRPLHNLEVCDSFEETGLKGAQMRRDLRQVSFADGLVNQRAGRNGWMDEIDTLIEWSAAQAPSASAANTRPSPRALGSRTCSSSPTCSSPACAKGIALESSLASARRWPPASAHEGLMADSAMPSMSRASMSSTSIATLMLHSTSTRFSALVMM